MERKAVITIEITQMIGFSSFKLLSTARGPLASLSALDVMWVSFYAIGLLLGAILVITAVRKWIHQPIIAFFVKLIAYGMFLVGSFLMVLTIATWPN
jgi:hypothetical protein